MISYPELSCTKGAKDSATLHCINHWSHVGLGKFCFFRDGATLVPNLIGTYSQGEYHQHVVTTTYSDKRIESVAILQVRQHTYLGGVPCLLCLSSAKKAMVCTVFPKPISSASTPFTPAPRSKHIQFTPTSWYLQIASDSIDKIEWKKVKITITTTSINDRKGSWQYKGKEKSIYQFYVHLPSDSHMHTKFGRNGAKVWHTTQSLKYIHEPKQNKPIIIYEPVI